MFAANIIERELPQWSAFPAALRDWTQSAGTVAALGLLIWGLAQFLQGNFTRRRLLSTPRSLWVFGSALVSVVAFVALLALFPLSWMLPRTFQKLLPSLGATEMTLGDWLYTVAGAAALVAVITPPFLDLFTSFRWGRIWALARLAVKEAVRSRVIYIFAAMALVFLFADWFVPYTRGEDQVRNYIRVIYWSMTPLFLMTASLLGAFSIPTDVRNQSIHTIVTKPVEKFEILLGRFLGYGFILTVGLLLVAGLSLIYMTRSIHPSAQEESLRARRPVIGMLSFLNTRHREKGDDVGRVWGYRSYITGRNPTQPDAPQPYAVWAFDDIPSDLGAHGDVRLEYTFDIFRLTKGEQGKGVFCTFALGDGRLNPAEVPDRLKLVRKERERLQTQARQDLAGRSELAQRFRDIEVELIKTHGVYEERGVEVHDFVTQGRHMPAAFFRHMLERDAEEPRPPGAAGKRPPLLWAMVSVDFGSHSQLVGMARRDLYLLADDDFFAVNFFKGVIGMWCTVMLVLGLALACSTYLSGVISWLTTLFLVGTGLFTDYITRLAEGRLPGGGAFQSFHRIFTRIQHSAPLEETATLNILQTVDEVYAWFLRRFINLIPDVTRHDLHKYVGNGFDISWGQVILLDNIIPLIGYLFPWFVLGYYTMKYREIANPS